MELKELKIKKITELSSDKVIDLTVDEVQHYITKNGVIHHNSGLSYGASIILQMSRAQLKDGDTKAGVIVTIKPDKNRFAIPHTIKIHIRFDSGMNPYIGLEQYISWKNCGIGLGRLIDEKTFLKLKEKKSGEAIIEIESTKFETLEGDILYYCNSDNSKAIGLGKADKTLCVKHLGKEVEPFKLYSSQVITPEIIDLIDEIIKPQFQYSDSSDVECINDLEMLDDEDIVLDSGNDPVSKVFED